MTSHNASTGLDLDAIRRRIEQAAAMERSTPRARTSQWVVDAEALLAEVERLQAVAYAAGTVARYAPSNAAAEVKVDALPMIDLVNALDDPCPHDSVDTFSSGAGRRVDVCMGCHRVMCFWNVNTETV